MNDTPLISVIIAFLDPGAWLIESIDSVISQTYQNWEIILVDDGSKPEDSNIAISFCKKLSCKIFYFEHEQHQNRGLTISRNVGISKAKGELIAFLDADDYWLPNKLLNQIDLFIKLPTIQVICEASWFWYNWKDSCRPNELVKIGAPEGIYTPPELMYQLYPLGEGQPPCPSGIIITREALQRADGFEETFSGVYQLYEDQAFLSKIYSQEVIYISAEANNLYRKREDSMSSAANDGDIYQKVRLFYYEWLQDHFSKKQPHPYIKTLIADFYRKLISG